MSVSRGGRINRAATPMGAGAGAMPTPELLPKRNGVRCPNHAGAVAWVERNGLSLWLGESDSAGPRVVYASTSS